MNPRFASFPTHALLLIAGCVLYSRFHHDGGQVAPGAPVASVKPEKGSPRKVDLTPAAEAILKGLLPKPAAAASDPATDWRAIHRQYQIDAVKLMREMPDEPDPAGALDREVAAEHPAPGEPGWHGNPRIAALIYQWIRKDPAALSAWIEGDEAHFLSAIRHLDPSMTEALKSPGAVDKLVSVAADLPNNGVLLCAMATSLGNERNTGPLEAMKAALPAAEWTDFCAGIAGSWPEDQRDSLVALAVAQNQPKMILEAFGDPGGSNGPGKEGAADALTKLFSDPSLPDDFRQALLADKRIAEAVAADPAAPLALRLQFTEGATEGEKYRQISTQAVDAFVSGGDVDWMGRVRTGDVTAAELLAAISAKSPELAGSAPNELRDGLFAALAGSNPVAALKLLDGLPAGDRNQAILDATRTRFHGADPQGFLAVLQQVPADTPELWDSRLDSWNHGVQFMSLRQGGNFSDWVEDLPPGTDREMALYALARKMEMRGDSVLVSQLRSQVTDPKLQQMIAEKR